MRILNGGSSRRLVAARAAAALVGAGLLGWATPAIAAPGDDRSGITARLEPALGSPVDNLYLLGAAGDEIWGYGRLANVPAEVGDQSIPSVQPPSSRPVVFVVYRPGEGWSVADEPRDTDGTPLQSFQPLGISSATRVGAGDVDAAGDAAVLGAITNADGEREPGLLVRAPGGTFNLVPSPRTVSAARTLIPADPLIRTIETGSPDVPASGMLPPIDADPVVEADAPQPAADPVATRSSDNAAGASPVATTPSAASDATPAAEPVATTPEATLEPTPVETAPTPEPAPADVATTTPAEMLAATTPALPPLPAPSTPAAGPTSAAERAAGPDMLASYEELFSEGQNTAERHMVMAVREPSGAAGALVGIVDSRADTTAAARVESSVFHWDGTAWTREELDLPDGSALLRGMRLVALGGTGLDDAWLLARSTGKNTAGLILFRREVGGIWKRRTFKSAWAQSAPTGKGVTALAPLAQPAQSLTVGPNGLWIDGSFAYGGQTYPFTVFYDKAADAITGSWCDAAASGMCMNPLGAGLKTTGLGYRSFAWGGGGPFGQRVITNALLPGGTRSRGARLVLDGAAFTRTRGLGGASGDDAALSSPNEGWLVAPSLTAGRPLVHVTDAPEGSRLQEWPVPARRPLLAVTGESGKATGASDAQALAVGLEGTIARYVPGDGWRPEFLQNSEGVRQRPTLRGVAWPEANRAHAVGDDGAMWVWRAATGLWEPDASKPLDFFSNLMGVAFDPSDPARGYAVGRQGTLLAYGKTWTQETLPAEAAAKDITSVTFAGRRAYAVFRDAEDENLSGVLVNDGNGWSVDQDLSTLLAGTRGAKLYAIHGLPDGGVVAGGYNIVVKRSGPTAPWRLAKTPPTNLAVVSIRAIRESGTLRAVIAAFPAPVGVSYPAPEILPITLPGESPQLLPSIAPPQFGTLLREGSAGQWLDERHQDPQVDAAKDVDDLQADNDQTYALMLNDAGTAGWAVGGYVNRTDTLSGYEIENARRRSAAAFRYPADASSPPPLRAGGVSVASKRVRLAFGGHASCLRACADFANVGIAADVGLQSAVAAAGQLRGQPYGPRAFVYAGPRLASGQLDGDEAERFAQVARSGSTEIPFYAAPGPDASASGAAPYRRAFNDFSAPFGAAPAPLGIVADGMPAARASTGAGARTQYAFDSTGAAGTVRVIVVDNAAGSLAAADPPGTTPEGSQEAWLIATLEDARRDGIPAIVVGDRDANSLAPVGSNTADDAQSFAELLVTHGASAYLFDSPGINRTAAIPARAAKQIPEFGNGTLGRASSPPPNESVPYYGEAGYLMVELDAETRDPATNIATVTARLIPVLDELSIDPTDGVLLRRSKVSKWSGLGRRPRMGDVDPYQAYPPTNCQKVACPGRIEPEFSFTSSRPDVADFVQQDKRSGDDHAILTDANDKPIPDAASGLLCAYNRGTTDITVTAGGLTYTQRVTVQAGAIGPPCGTRPLSDPPTQLPTSAEAPSVAPQDPVAPEGNTPAGAIPFAVPPPPAVTPETATPPKVSPPSAPVEPAFVAAAAAPLVPVVSSIVPPSIARPLPPPGMTGVSQPVVEEKREEEEATESSQAYSVAKPFEDLRRIGGSVLVLLLIGAGATSMAAGSRRRPAPRTARALSATRPTRPRPQRRRRW